ncbi:hypothetical protein CAEBREN_25020 [Caenorhabditis brenneri]|uniref:Uncharacterized protein n=1 Tax=Caenorhabditis brenneri TaxID=135651 RepID=G0ML61_CAEBE|nr:hypothetical protein CAEBREN_25020 [Caenorhabditis brenneri]
MPNVYPILILLLFLSTCLAGPTIIITGSAEQNTAKLEFLGRYVPQSVLKNDQPIKPKALIYNRNEIHDSLIEDFESVQQIGGVSLARNLSSIAITNDVFDELDTDVLTLLSSLLRTNRALFVVEFGETLQNSPVLLENADCWASSTVQSQTANTVYFCGKKLDVIPFEIINERIPIVKVNTPTVSSFFFVSAASKKYRLDKKKMEEDLEDEIQDIVEESMKTVEKKKKDLDDDDDDDGNEFDNKHDPKRDHRLHCKYRKSCYETGKRGLIEPYDISFDHIFHFWRAPASQQHHLPKTVDADQDGVPDSEDDDVNLADRKLVCKYRTACYKEHNIPLSDKQQERERSFMTAKLQAPQGKKRTLKDIAQKAVSGVKEKEEEAKNRPVPKSLIVEKKLQEIENQLQKKLDCKYRKSCYETGKLPDIEESSFSVPFFSHKSENDDDADDKEEQKPFEEMEDLEKKHYCKYRKSCYKTGEKPDIESEISIDSFHDILEMPDIVETRKLTLQERCKYRKSCYETGVLPDLSRDDEHIEKVINKEVSSVVPSTVQDLKTLCKYRKSCYQEISESSSADIVQTIRKRRMIEKEVRKRRTRRHRRLHKRHAMMTRYGMTSASASKYDKVEKTQKELQDIADAREQRKDAPAPKSVKLHGKKKTTKVVEDVIEQNIVEKVTTQPEEEKEEAEPETTKPKKGKRSLKKVREPEPEPEVEDIFEPEQEPEPEPVKKSKKNSKKVKEVEPEPENEDDDQDPEAVPEPAKKPKKSLKKSKGADFDAAKEPELAPIPVPVIKVVKKESKQDNEDDDDDDNEVNTSAELKNSPLKESAEDDEEDDGNEFDNKHDPKRDHRLHCKYRKTCYETGKRGLIEPYDFSLWHIVHFWAAPPSQQHHDYGKHKDSDGDGVPDVADKDAAMTDRKLSCKYRPSCYEKYDIPVGEKILEREQKRTSESFKDNDSEDDDDEEERKVDLNAANRRLECKYRRSCYDSGVLPTIRQWSDAPTLSETIEYSSKNLKMQKCKYRKSCYEAAGITDKDDDADKEELKTPLVQENLKPVQSSTDRHHSKHGKKKHQEPKDSDEDNDDEDEEQKEKQKKNKEEKKEELKVHEQSDKETLEREGKEISLSVAEKSWCKYRKSCYSSVEPKAAKQDHSGSMARRAGSGQKCHVYYLSCREAMGLPPKEKAPMGPNGKRLCRKVKKDN